MVAPHPPANIILAEKPFYSIQGEGPLVGTPMLFVRTAGCDVRCKWCDSKYAWENGSINTNVIDLLKIVLESPHKYICLTGGEPLIYEIFTKQFCIQVGMVGKKVLLETSGTRDISVVSNLTNVTIDCDIKPPSAEAQKPFEMDNLKRLRKKHYLKAAIASYEDYDWFRKFYRQNKDAIKCDIYLQPVVCPTTGYSLKKLAENILEDKLPFKLGFQLHKLIWGFAQGR